MAAHRRVVLSLSSWSSRYSRLVSLITILHVNLLSPSLWSWPLSSNFLKSCPTCPEDIAGAVVWLPDCQGYQVVQGFELQLASQGPKAPKWIGKNLKLIELVGFQMPEPRILPMTWMTWEGAGVVMQGTNAVEQLNLRDVNGNFSGRTTLHTKAISLPGAPSGLSIFFMYSIYHICITCVHICIQTFLQKRTA